MAGNENAHGIVPDGAAYGLGRHARAPLAASQLAGQSSVGGSRTVRNAPQQRPYGQPKRGALQMQRRCRPRIVTGEITIEPSDGTFENGSLSHRGTLGERCGEILLALEPDSGQAELIGREGELAQRRRVLAEVLHTDAG